ncbi:hypothetical protein HY68_23395 [Streptomyces sp. AcH 505]|nr:hypothetical protein HY68_23395 [Streptomyces sp. AcH 505]
MAGDGLGGAHLEAPAGQFELGALELPRPLPAEVGEPGGVGRGDVDGRRVEAFQPQFVVADAGQLGPAEDDVRAGDGLVAERGPQAERVVGEDEPQRPVGVGARFGEPPVDASFRTGALGDQVGAVERPQPVRDVLGGRQVGGGDEVRTA